MTRIDERARTVRTLRRVESDAPDASEPDVEQLYREAAPAVAGYFRAHGVREVDDLTSEVFAHVLRNIATFEGDGRALRRWVFTIAHHRLVDHYRWRRRQPSWRPLDDLGADPADRDVAGPLDPELVAALGRLTRVQRDVVALRFVADLSLDEVAQLLGRETGAVKSLQHRALARLESMLDAGRSADLSAG